MTGAGLQPAYGHTARAGGWGKGGYTMMPGPAGYPSRESAAARNTVTAAVSENWAGYAAAGSAGAFTQVSASWSEPAVTSFYQPIVVATQRS